MSAAKQSSRLNQQKQLTDKKVGIYRLCIDYRSLNAISIKDLFLSTRTRAFLLENQEEMEMAQHDKRKSLILKLETIMPCTEMLL